MGAGHRLCFPIVLVFTIWPATILPPGRVGILLMTEVIFGLASAMLLLAEVLTPLQAVGAVLIVAASVIEVTGTVGAAAQDRSAASSVVVDLLAGDPIQRRPAEMDVASRIAPAHLPMPLMETLDIKGLHAATDVVDRDAVA